MKKQDGGIKVICYGLAALYAASIFICGQTYRLEYFVMHAITLTVLFTLLLIGAVAAAWQRDLGRRFLVLGNVILGIYLLFLSFKFIFKFIDVVPLAYIFMSFIVFLYFTQPEIKAKFQNLQKSNKWFSILIVDDDETLIRMVRPILISHGFSVLVASTGETGLQIARTQKPDLIILDVILPGIKGREVCKKLKEDHETKNIPVIFLTAKFSPDDIEAERKAGAEKHLTKPVNANELVTTVKDILSRKSA